MRRPALTTSSIYHLSATEDLIVYPTGHASLRRRSLFDTNIERWHYYASCGLGDVCPWPGNALTRASRSIGTLKPVTIVTAHND